MTCGPDGCCCERDSRGSRRTGPGERSVRASRSPMGIHLNASRDARKHSNGCPARSVRPLEGCHPASPRGRMEPQPFVRIPALSAGPRPPPRTHAPTHRPRPPPGSPPRPPPRPPTRRARERRGDGGRARVAHRLHRRTERRRRDRHHPRPHVLRAPRGGAVPAHRVVPARRGRRGCGGGGRDVRTAGPGGHGVRAARRRGRAGGIRPLVRGRRRRGARGGRRGLHARVGRRRRARRGRHGGGTLPRHPVAAAAAARRDRASGCRGGTRRRMDRARGIRRRRPALRLPGRHARRRPAFLPRRGRAALPRRHRAGEAQRAAPAPHRRPGLAHPDRLVARAHGRRRLDLGGRRRRRLLLEGRLPPHRRVRRRAVHHDRARDRPARAHECGAQRLPRAELRRGRSRTLRGRRGRLLVTLRLARAGRRDRPVPGRRHPRARRAHARAVAAPRRRRVAVDEPRRLPRPRAADDAGRRRDRQDDHRMARDGRLAGAAQPARSGSTGASSSPRATRRSSPARSWSRAAASSSPPPTSPTST